MHCGYARRLLPRDFFTSNAHVTSTVLWYCNMAQKYDTIIMHGIVIGL